MSGVRLRIIGLGNPLRGDDGAGCAVAAELNRDPLPAEVEVLDGGTGGLTLLHLLVGADRVILVDSAEMDLPPGSHRRVELQSAEMPDDAGFAVHQAGLAEVLALGSQLGLLPPVLELRAIQPESTGFRNGLTPSVAAAVAEIVAELRSEFYPAAS